MNKKPLPIGVEDFGKLIRNEYYYVDKTLFIKELLDKKGEVSLFTRPRRFGKTLTLSMLQYFFEDTGSEEINEQNTPIFPDFIRRWQTSYVLCWNLPLRQTPVWSSR